MIDHFTFEELCLIENCLCRKVEQEIKDFQEGNGWLYGCDVPKNINAMCDKLQALSDLIQKVNEASTEACQKRAKEKAND